MRALLFAAVLLTASAANAQSAAEGPVKATVCELLKDPGTWNHKLVQVTGFASHGFEDSGFRDPGCDIQYPSLWMSYGGKRQTGTISTVNENQLTRAHIMKVEGFEVPLIEDDKFQQFDRLLHLPAINGTELHSTVVARFFAGNLDHNNDRGYGHLGCCSLFVIQQVLDIDENRDAALDNSTSASPPRAQTIQFLKPPQAALQLQSAQREAERGTGSYRFDDPRRLALEALLRYSGTTDPGAVTLKQESATPARIVYEGAAPGSDRLYRIVLSRPYWLSRYAVNPHRVIWTVLAAFVTGEPLSDRKVVEGTSSVLSPN